MGVSTDAILAFGFELGDELPFSEEVKDQADFDENWQLIHQVVGFNETWASSKGNFFERQREAAQKSGVEFVHHCSGEYPMYLLAAIDSIMTANRGYPVEVADLSAALKVEPEWIENLERAAKILGIEGKPKWWLVSMWH